jgi:flagellar biosynthesis protein FlhG
LAGRDDPDARPTKKLGRGLSEVSHLFFSGKERTPSTLTRRAGDAQERVADEWTAPDTRLWHPRATYIAITSGDGVRGKTFLAASLAFGLVARGRRVAVVNADVARPDVLDVLGSSRPDSPGAVGAAGGAYGGIPTADALAQSNSAFPDAAMAWPEPPGSPAGAPSPMPVVDPLPAIDAVARDGQTVIIDIPSGADLGPAVWQMSNLAIVVVEPGAEKIKASYVAIKRIHAASSAARIGLAINRVQSYAEGEECFRKLAEICRKFLKINLRNYGYVLEDAAASEALLRAVPLTKAFPDSIAARCIDSILGLIVMDESAIARRRKEVTLAECASRRDRLEVLRS